MSGLFISRATENPQEFFMWIFLVVFSICFHEYSHAQVALWEGDPTARDEGHLTLNPLKQMGIFSLVMLAIVGIAWGAVPVNPQRMRRRISPLLVSLAGPVANLILYVMFTTVLYLIAIYGKGRIDENVAMNASSLFFLGAVLNLTLFCFNMIPAPPLDGYAVFKFFSHRGLNEHSELIKGLAIGLILLAFIGIGYVFRFSAWLTMQWGTWLGLTEHSG